jgi:hypothetical protein
MNIFSLSRSLRLLSQLTSVILNSHQLDSMILKEHQSAVEATKCIAGVITKEPTNLDVHMYVIKLIVFMVLSGVLTVIMVE